MQIPSLRNNWSTTENNKNKHYEQQLIPAVYTKITENLIDLVHPQISQIQQWSLAYNKYEIKAKNQFRQTETINTVTATAKQKLQDKQRHLRDWAEFLNR